MTFHSQKQILFMLEIFYPKNYVHNKNLKIDTKYY